MPHDPRRQIPVFRFVGHSGTGKTTLLERVITLMAERGLRVAVVKDTHHPVEFDQPGKDSWRLARAGASQVVVSSPGRLVLFQARSSRATLADVAELVAPTADILLAEGFRDDPQPAVLVWRAVLGQPLPTIAGPIHAVVADQPTTVDAPAFGFDDIPALVIHLLSR